MSVRFFSCFIGFACSLVAQTPIGLTIAVTEAAPRTIAATWGCQGDCDLNAQLVYWRAGDPPEEHRDPPVLGDPNSFYWDYIIGLEPATRYFILPIVFNAATGAASPGDTSLLCSGTIPADESYECLDSGGGRFVPSVVTPADPAQFPEDPYPPLTSVPDELLFEEPHINGERFLVDADCTELQSMLTACGNYADQHPGTTSVVEIPAGSVCDASTAPSRSFTAPSILSTESRCILRSAAEPRFLPPPGSPMGPYYPHGIVSIVGGARYGRDRSLLTIGDNWRIGPGLQVRLTNPDEIEQRRVAVTAFNGATVTAPGHGFPGNAVVNVYLEGIKEADWQEGQCQVVERTANTFKCRSVQPGSGNFATGFVTDSPVWSIVSCSASGVCSVPDHPYKNHSEAPILSWSGKTVSFSENISTMFRKNASMKLVGMAGGCPDVTLGITAVTGTQITTSAPSPFSCTGGRARMLQLVDIRGTSNSAADGAYVVSWRENVMVIEAPQLPALIAGGFVSHDPAQLGLSLIAARQRHRPILDRVWLGGNSLDGFPHQLQAGAGFTETSSAAVVGIYDSAMSACLPVDPHSGVVSRTFSGFSKIHTAVANSGAADFRMVNSKMSTAGWLLFADAGPALHETRDIDVDGIEVAVPDDVKSPTSDRRGCNVRQTIEQKAVNRARIQNFGMTGTVASNIADGAGIAIIGAPDSAIFENPQRDLQIQNGFINGAGGVSISNLNPPGLRQSPMRRISVSHVHVNVRRDLYLSDIAGQSLEVPFSWITGHSAGLRISGSPTSVDIRNNSFFGQGLGPLAVWIPRRGSGWTLVGNILGGSYRDTRTSGLLNSFDAAWTDAHPPSPALAAGWTAWKNMIQTPDSGLDAFSRFDNKVAACTTHGNAPGWYFGNSGPVRTWIDLDLGACSAEGCPRFEFEVAGRDGASCAENLDEIFLPSSWERKPGTWVGYGPDWSRIKKGLDRFEPTVSPVPGGVRLSFDAPKADRPCYAQVYPFSRVVGSSTIPDLRFPSDWVSSGIGEGLRSITLMGGGRGSVVYWSAVCGLYRVWGSSRVGA